MTKKQKTTLASLRGEDTKRKRAKIQRVNDPAIVQGKNLIIELIQTYPTLKQASDAAGLRYTDVQKWMQDDDNFYDAYQQAIAIWKDRIREVLWDRAINGVEEAVIYQGRRMYETDPDTNELVRDDQGRPIPLVTRKPSDRLMERLIDTVPEHAKTSHGGNRKGPAGLTVNTPNLSIQFVQPTTDDQPTDEHITIDVTPDDESSTDT